MKTVHVVLCQPDEFSPTTVAGVYTNYDDAIAMANVCHMENQDAMVQISENELDDTSDLYIPNASTPEYLAHILCEGCHVHPMAEADIVKELTPLLGGTKISKSRAYKFITGDFIGITKGDSKVGDAWLVCKRYMDIHDKYVNSMEETNV